MGLLTLGMGTDGSGLNVVVTHEAKEHPIEVDIINTAEIDTEVITSELETTVMKVNLETGEKTELKVEVCK